jgi:cyclic-di-GMP-binding protein
MFGFLKSRNDPLADARSAARWCSTPSTADALALKQDLIAELSRVTAPTAKLTPRRLSALFVIDAHAEHLFRSLTAQYAEHANRSAKIERQLWSALFELSQAFQTALRAYEHAALDNEHSGRWQQLLPELVCRQIVHLGHDAKARLYRYESWIPGKWAELHQLLALAAARQFERIPITLVADRPATTIEQQYLMIVVLQLLDTGNLTPRQLEQVWGELDGWCQTLRLSLEPKTLSSFFIDLASRDGMKRRTGQALEGSVLFVDTQPVHGLLMQQQVAVEQAIRVKPRGEETTRLSEQLCLLRRFAAKVDPEPKLLPRHGERAIASGNIDAIVGLNKIASYLREQDRDPDFQLYAGKSFGGSLELAVFGRVRNESDRRNELARHRLTQYAAPGGPWEMKDVSQTGFRLIAPMKAASDLPIGTLVATRPQTGSQWTLGIVRRMRRHTSERTEIGLEIVASRLTGVDLVEQRRSAEADYLVDGEDGFISGRSFIALFLTLQKDEGGHGVQSLILPAGEYHPSKRLTLVTAKSIYRVVLGGPIEQQGEWVWTAVEPQEIGARTAATSNRVGHRSSH